MEHRILLLSMILLLDTRTSGQNCYTGTDGAEGVTAEECESDKYSCKTELNKISGEKTFSCGSRVSSDSDFEPYCTAGWFESCYCLGNLCNNGTHFEDEDSDIECYEGDLNNRAIRRCPKIYSTCGTFTKEDGSKLLFCGKSNNYASCETRDDVEACFCTQDRCNTGKPPLKCYEGLFEPGDEEEENDMKETTCDQPVQSCVTKIKVYEDGTLESLVRGCGSVEESNDCTSFQNGTVECLCSSGEHLCNGEEPRRLECFEGTAFDTMDPKLCDYGVVNCKTEVKDDFRTDFSCGSGLSSDTGGCNTSPGGIKTCFCSEDRCNDDPNSAGRIGNHVAVALTLTMLHAILFK